MFFFLSCIEVFFKTKEP